MEKSQVQLLLELAKELRETPRTKEEILASLVEAKILTKKGNFTRHYPELRAYLKKYKRYPW